ncbi:MAG: prephenate dehydratase domain-containing protein [Nanoarchaeota archaeon]
MKFGLLGPDGTFSAEAGHNYLKRKKFKSKFKFYTTISGCFTGIEKGEIDLAIVPLLSSSGGAAWVNETLQNLREKKFMIYDEEILKIDMCLASISKINIKKIKFIHSKDKALEQCMKKINEIGAQTIPENSTATAAEKIKKLNDPTRAVIIPKRTAEIYDLTILEEAIQDKNNNQTKFAVIGKKDNIPTGNDKTTLIFEFANGEKGKVTTRAGLLYSFLKELEKEKISMTYIQSIPKDGSLEEFTFYCDIIGHRKDIKIVRALKEIRKNVDLKYLKVLGSYPMYN